MTKSAKRKAHDAAKTTRPVPTGYLPAPYLPVAITRLDLAFPANVRHLMPAPEDIPSELRGFRGKHADLFADWFFRGLESIELTLRDPAMDKTQCIGHIRCIMGGFEPAHGDKGAAVRFLLDRWFSEIKWKAKS